MPDSQYPEEFETLRVLVVDDEEAIRDLIQEILRDMGIVRVHLAENGVALVRLANRILKVLGVKNGQINMALVRKVAARRW